jgi:4-hydroxy 2-oxovalerate aldolase
MVKILDCTLRDGGYVNNWSFSNEQVLDLYNILNKNNIDYMELGFRTTKKDSLQFGDQYYCEESYINELFKTVSVDTCKICVMCEIGKFDSSMFVEKDKSKISMVRVLMSYHSIKNTTDDIIDIKTLNEGINQINKLIDLGYDVTFNIGRIDKISIEQLCVICEKVSQTKVKYFIMADTYGSLDLHLTQKYVSVAKNLFETVFKTNIKIGFHAHDNLKNATSKALHSIDCGAELIDSCVHGFGRGSGNAITELLMLNLNKQFNKNYDFFELMMYGQKHLTSYNNADEILSKKNILYILSAYYGMHVNYAIECINKNISIEEANIAFLKICDIKKNMYYFDDLLYDTLNYYDENGKVIDHKTIERTEQTLANKYIDANDVVLELGARYLV